MPDQPVATTPPPGDSGPSWLTIFAGFSFVATVLVLAAILLVRFSQQRPVNLEEPSVQTGRQVERTLRAAFLPTTKIEVQKSERHDERGSAWIHHDFKVTVAAQLDMEGIAGLVERDLRVQNLTLTRKAPTEGAAAGLLVWLTNLEVASIAFEQLTAATPERADLRAASGQLADQMKGALTTLGATVIFSGEPESREDTDAQWLRTQLEAELKEAMEPEALADQLRAAITIAETEVLVGEPKDGKISVTVQYRKKPCVEAALTLGTPVPTTASPMEGEPLLMEMMAPALPGDSPAPLTEPDPAHSMAPSMPAPTEPDIRLARLETAPPSRSHEPPSGSPRIALVLDDGGYDLELAARAMALGPNVTFAILPNTPFGEQVALEAASAGNEILLHMPMETDSPTVKPFPGQVELAMADEEITRLTLDAFAQIPGAVGVNNHMGSKFTSDAGRMALFLEHVRDKGWFFLDSVTGPNSQGMATAHAMAIPTARRHVFLDDVADSAEIARQWKELLRLARKNGEAIAIGHFRPLTLDVLERDVPQLVEEGIEMVHVSELMQ